MAHGGLTIFGFLAPGSVPEAPVSNREFLEGFIRYGVWLRVVKAVAHVDVIKQSNSTDLARLAAVTGLYEQTGLQIEDTLTNLIAWSLWKLNRAILLADILKSLEIKLGGVRQADSTKYCESVRRQFLNRRGSQLRVDAFSYLYGLSRDSSGLVTSLGIPWKKHPSVKLCPPGLRPIWDRLPEGVDTLLDKAFDTHGGVLSQAKNKLKHGPQLSFESLAVAANRRFGRSAAQVARDEARQEWLSTSVRILFAGARRQETADEIASSTVVAPFLASKSQEVETWLSLYLTLLANISASLATFLCVSIWNDMAPLHIHTDPEILSLLNRGIAATTPD